MVKPSTQTYLDESLDHNQEASQLTKLLILYSPYSILYYGIYIFFSFPDIWYGSTGGLQLDLHGGMTSETADLN